MCFFSSTTALHFIQYHRSINFVRCFCYMYRLSIVHVVCVPVSINFMHRCRRVNLYTCTIIIYCVHILTENSLQINHYVMF